MSIRTAKTCITCKQEKRLGEFYSYPYTTSQGKRSTRWESQCNGCRLEKRKQQYRKLRANPLKSAEATRAHVDRCRQYAGLPEPTRTEPVICECCGKAPIGQRLCLDHDHASGRFRGWLCRDCNMAIGKLGDTLDGVERARDYMLRATFT